VASLPPVAALPLVAVLPPVAALPPVTLLPPLAPPAAPALPPVAPLEWSSSPADLQAPRTMTVVAMTPMTFRILVFPGPGSTVVETV